MASQVMALPQFTLGTQEILAIASSNMQAATIAISTIWWDRLQQLDQTAISKDLPGGARSTTESTSPHPKALMTLAQAMIRRSFARTLPNTTRRKKCR